jgi:catechol 2,3-dioxygenase-like lactoylglutathione lyase family enzyme
MLLDGYNHVAILTSDTDRFIRFYREVCVANPDGKPGVFNPPGTPARRYAGS